MIWLAAALTTIGCHRRAANPPATVAPETARAVAAPDSPPGALATGSLIVTLWDVLRADTAVRGAMLYLADRGDTTAASWTDFARERRWRFKHDETTHVTRMDSIPPGPYTLRVRRIGYEEAMLDIDVREQCTLSVTIHLLLGCCVDIWGSGPKPRTRFEVSPCATEPAASRNISVR